MGRWAPNIFVDAIIHDHDSIFGEVFHKLAVQKESRIEQGHLQPDHVHMLISIPPATPTAALSDS